MSKIQDALRRIQSESKPRRHGAKNGNGNGDELAQTTRLGQLQHELDDTGVRVIPDDGGLVVVDREILRREGYLAPKDQERDLADQYRLIKRPLLDNASGRGDFQADDANLIMVTSALPGDGKTFTGINLALSMALEKDTSVLLVDADVAKPHVSELFDVPDQPGLIDLLTDETIDTSRFVMRTDVPGLSLLPAGSADEHATELLASRRMEIVIEELSRKYPDRIVIFDSPPLLVTSEARVLAASVGQIAMVVRAGVTQQEAVLEALDSLDQTKAINLILNESSASILADGFSAYGGYGVHAYGR
ncbi:MAG: XrtA-associated tyrosine autokinase [Woeseiaceae bacterium]|nr:XrtA-associated tyrosine autokinase [Woeseiaceae bacterium]